MWLESTHQALSWPCTESEHQVQHQNLKYLPQTCPLLHSERRRKIHDFLSLLFISWRKSIWKVHSCYLLPTPHKVTEIGETGLTFLNRAEREHKFLSKENTSFLFPPACASLCCWQKHEVQSTADSAASVVRCRQSGRKSTDCNRLHFPISPLNYSSS